MLVGEKAMVVAVGEMVIEGPRNSTGLMPL